MSPWHRVVLAAALLATVGVNAECRLGFGTDGGGGVFTFGVKAGGEAGPLEAVAGTAGERLDQRSALAVDATRGIFLWSEEDPETGRHSVLKKVSAGKATVAVAAAETGRGRARAARNIHGISLDAATHTAYVSVYDDHGAFRIFSLDYADDTATPDWEWCGDKRCGVRSDFPSGGVLSAVGGRVCGFALLCVSFFLPAFDLGVHRVVCHRQPPPQERWREADVVHPRWAAHGIPGFEWEVGRSKQERRQRALCWGDRRCGS